MKRRLALFTAICMMLFSLSAVAQAFSDMPAENSEYYPAFEYAINNKIINGSDGKLLPDNPVTKAEAVTFITRAKPFKTEAADLSGVSDVSADAWYYMPMAQAVAANIIAVDESNKLNPTEVLTRRAAWDMLYKVFGTGASYTPISDGEKTATRGDFILWLYSYVKPQVTEPSSQAPSEAETQAPTEGDSTYSQIREQQAQEAMQVALGILPDGTSYVKVAAYKDVSYSDWATGKTISSGSSSGSSGSSGGSSGSSGGSTGGSHEDETQAPTEKETQAPSENETQAPTEKETQAPTEPPTYNGPIDNDKDNVIEDPFDDGWKPNTGGDSSEDNDGGYDDEDEDFIINDADEPDYQPETQAPTEESTEKEPSEDATDATEEESSEDVTDATEEESSEDTTDATEEESSEDTTDATEEGSSEDVTDATEEESSEDTTDATEEEPSEDTTDATEEESSEDVTDKSDEEPSEDTTDATEEESSEDVTDKSDEEPSEEAGDTPEENEGEGEDDSAPQLLAWLFSKDWWFN